MFYCITARSVLKISAAETMQALNFLIVAPSSLISLPFCSFLADTRARKLAARNSERANSLGRFLFFFIFETKFCLPRALLWHHRHLRTDNCQKGIISSIPHQSPRRRRPMSLNEIERASEPSRGEAWRQNPSYLCLFVQDRASERQSLDY